MTITSEASTLDVHRIVSNNSGRVIDDSRMTLQLVASLMLITHDHSMFIVQGNCRLGFNFNLFLANTMKQSLVLFLKSSKGYQILIFMETLLNQYCCQSIFGATTFSIMA
jgi:hypothetical protein